VVIADSMDKREEKEVLRTQSKKLSSQSARYISDRYNPAAVDDRHVKYRLLISTSKESQQV
jgi:hypothetical protein